MFTFPHSRTALLKPPTASSTSVPLLLDTSHQRGKHALCSAAVVSLAASVFCSFPVKLRRVSSFPWVRGPSPSCLQIPQWGFCPHALWHRNSSRSMFSSHFWPPSLLTLPLLLTPVITLLRFHNLHLLPRMSESWFSSWLAGFSPSPFLVPHHCGLLFLEWPQA